MADEFTITRVGLHLQRLVPWLWVGGRWLAAGVLGLAVLVWAGGASAEEAPAEELTSKVAPPSLVLITLDTTRNDFVGPTVEGGASRTPALDRLAGQGVRYRRAVAPSPLTLPSHASLLTGLEPPEHGVRVNGSVALPQDLPTLATLLTAHGFDSAAFVATRVLDRRFGLARGFALYDDRMVAERLGEYGYPERDAAAVTTAALAWTAGRDPVRPFFLWVHYYDPHFPYAAPGSTGGSVHALYADEIAFMDRQIGRLLDGLPATPERIVAVVGDHGESLGEHGERTHGIFLYRSVMEVPLIVAGSGVPRGVQVSEPVATRRLAASLAQLVLPASDPTLPGPVLPGLDLTEIDPPSLPIYSESLMPAATYGWSPLTAVTTVQHRLIVAPRPELYDIAVDPGERRNLVRQERAVARQLRDTLTASEASFRQRQAAPVAADGQLAADLQALGYLSGGRGPGSGLDPKDGVALLDRLAEAGELLSAGQTVQALAILSDLNTRSPDNVPFLVRLASAQQTAGRLDQAVATFQRAIELDPQLEFLHHHLGQAHLTAGRLGAAEEAFRAALSLDPRFAKAWLSLAELAHRRDGSAAELQTLQAALDAEVESVAVLLRLAQIAMARKDPTAEEYLARACELWPELPLPWLMRAQVAIALRDEVRARSFLEQVIRVAPGSDAASQAGVLLSRLRVD